MKLEDKFGYLSFAKELCVWTVPGGLIYQARKDAKYNDKEKIVYFIAGGIEIIKLGVYSYYLLKAV